MASIKALLKESAIYGASSIVGRFLNYLLVPLYTFNISAASGGYGIVTNLYAYVALLLVILTFGMETTFFRFANKYNDKADAVFSCSMLVVGCLSLIFLLLIFSLLAPICSALGYEQHREYVWMMALIVALDALQAIPFSLLRFKQKAWRFAGLKLLFIVLNVLLNLVYFVVLPKTINGFGIDVGAVFAINLVCTALVSFFFIGDLKSIDWHIDKALLKQMIRYSSPLLVLGIAGILNQTADKMIFPLVYPDKIKGAAELSIYGACVKIAMIMALITQAFRYAYEPFVFRIAGNKDDDKSNAKATYALTMKYFVVATLFAFLCVVGYMDVLKYIVGSDYRQGLVVVPIVMAAEIMMGIYFNLSFWYKLIDKTIWGAVFSVVGCIVLIAVNIVFIPRYGYMAAAWGGCAGYGVAMMMSYIVGQKINKIDYPIKSIMLYVALAAALFIAMNYATSLNATMRISLNSLLILIYLVVICLKEKLLFAKQG